MPGPGYVNHTALVHNYGPARTSPSPFAAREDPPAGRRRSPQGGLLSLFTAYPGVNEISLDLQDAVAWDNHAYVYVPDLAQKRVLYQGEEGPALAALRSLPNVQVETSGEFSSFDLIVVARNASLDGKLNRYIDGGRVIYIASDLESPEYLPVRVTGDRRVRPASGSERGIC